MAEFPQDFTDNPTYIDAEYMVPTRHAPLFWDLKRKGFSVVAGLRESDVTDLTEIAQQEGTREYCPNDITQRWTDVPTARRQLAKEGGRAVFRLESTHDSSTIGFGWTGKSSEEERRYLPECENTFAIRLHEKARGEGLALPFTRAIVVGSIALYGARNIGLETWGSNTAAVRTYLKAGAELVTTKDDIRPTLRKDQQDADGNRRDVRLYMQFPWSIK